MATTTKTRSATKNARSKAAARNGSTPKSTAAAATEAVSAQSAEANEQQQRVRSEFDLSLKATKGEPVATFTDATSGGVLVLTPTTCVITHLEVKRELVKRTPKTGRYAGQEVERSIMTAPVRQFLRLAGNAHDEAESCDDNADRLGAVVAALNMRTDKVTINAIVRWMNALS